MVTSDPPAPVFSVTGLRLRFPGETGPIFEALDWELGTGSRWAVLGPSGAGKTLLMKVMTGLVRPDAGRIRSRAGS
jgi:ABC-type transporter Mla maintaining outer membrane lipid asymmetry ATPase subunit MlaF